MKFVPLHWTAAVAPNVLKRHPPSNAVRGRLRNSSDADLLHSSQESEERSFRRLRNFEIDCSSGFELILDLLA
jgi:hypothetical protein